MTNDERLAELVSAGKRALVKMVETEVLADMRLALQPFTH